MQRGIKPRRVYQAGAAAGPPTASDLAAALTASLAPSAVPALAAEIARLGIFGVRLHLLDQSLSFTGPGWDPMHLSPALCRLIGLVLIEAAELMEQQAKPCSKGGNQ